MSGAEFKLCRKTGFWIDKRIRQGMAPAMVRIIELLEANPKRSYSDVDASAAVHCSRDNAKKIFNTLHEAEIVRVAQWRRTPSAYQAAYTMACGKPDAEKPARYTDVEKSRRRRMKLKEMFGAQAWRVFQSRNHGGVGAIVRDGVTLYRRGQGVNEEAARRLLCEQ